MEPNNPVERTQEPQATANNVENLYPSKNNPEIMIPVFINFVVILIAGFLLYITHTLFWDYSQLNSNSIELGWIILGPFLLVFYSLVFCGFIFVVRKIFISGLKDLQKQKIPPLIDFRTLAKLAIVILVLLSIDLFYKTSIDKRDAINETRRNQINSSRAWDIRNEQRNKDLYKIHTDILSYKIKYNKLPQDLNTLKKTNFQVPVDPLTKNLYFYTHNDDNGNYAICAEKELSEKELSSIIEKQILCLYNDGIFSGAPDLNYVEDSVNESTKPVNQNYQPMNLEGRWDLLQNSGTHTVQAIIIGNGCSGKGINDNKVSVNTSRNTEYGWDNRFNWWSIWDEGCGLEKGNVVTFQIDGLPAGLSYTDGANKLNCLPFIANKIVKNVHIIPNKQPDLTCGKSTTP